MSKLSRQRLIELRRMALQVYLACKAAPESWLEDGPPDDADPAQLRTYRLMKMMDDVTSPPAPRVRLRLDDDDGVRLPLESPAKGPGPVQDRRSAPALASDTPTSPKVAPSREITPTSTFTPLVRRTPDDIDGDDYVGFVPM